MPLRGPPSTRVAADGLRRNASDVIAWAIVAACYYILSQRFFGAAR